MTSSKTTLTPEVLPAERRPVGRPAKVTTLVPDRSPADRAKTANSYHSLSRAAAQDAVAYAVMAGMELAAAKAQISHGSFLPWIEKHCEFSQQTANNYMRLAERMIASGSFRAVVPQLTDGQVQTAGDRKALLAAIRETADGATLQQLYFDFGILKPRGETLMGGAREGAGRPTKAEQTEREARMAYEDWKAISGPLGRYVSSRRYLYLKEAEMEEMMAVLRGAIGLIEDTLGKK